MQTEDAMSTSTARMNNALRNPLMIEMVNLRQPNSLPGKYLFSSMMVLQQSRSLLVAGNFKPDISIVDALTRVGSENGLVRGIFLVVIHLFDLVVLLELLHLLGCPGRGTTQRLLCFLE